MKWGEAVVNQQRLFFLLLFVAPPLFAVDGSTAGSGNLEILVNGGHVTSYVRELGDQCFLASFVPHQATVHTIDMKFNGETVTGRQHLQLYCSLFTADDIFPMEKPPPSTPTLPPQQSTPGTKNYNKNKQKFSE